MLIRAIFRLLAFLVACMPLAATAQAQQAQAFKPEEIEALVAPIALYPDTLLSQVLMASTYPLEIVQAARWVKANPNVKGDAALKAVEGQKWDVSVKSLVAFPQVLDPMSEKIDWTQKLGDAFLADQKAVMAAVQRLRQRAQESGNLKSSEQQKVVVEEAAPQQTVIRIEPASPQVVYVPAYNPTVVYGAWAYPAYPPYYWAPPPYYYPAGGALASGIAFGVGVATVGAIFGDLDWGRNEVNVNVNRATNIDRNFNRSTNVSSRGQWQHDASHRGGVAYRDTASREKYSRNVPGAEARQQYRGHERPAGDRARTSTSANAAAFDGVGSGAAAQRDFSRGQASSSHAAAGRSASAGASGFSGARAGGGGGARGGGGRR